MRSLVVDDDELSRMMHKEILSSISCCDVAANGAEAVQMFIDAKNSSEPYGFICMDVTMPVCNGHEAVSQIRKIEEAQGVSASNKVKIIMLSSSDDPKTVMESYYKGGTSYLVKPVSEKKLIQVLKNFKLI